MKKFIAGLLTGITLMSTATAYGYVEQTITAIFNKVSLYVDGTKVNGNTLLYNGTTYVPLRDAAEILGKEVGYDAETSTAYIGKVPTLNKTNKKENNENKKYTFKYGFLNYAAVSIKNTTNETIDIDVNFLLKDSSGNIVGVKNDNISAIAPQQEALLYSADDIEFSDFDYKITTKSSNYDSVINNVSIDSKIADDRIIINATNNGNKDMDFLKATVLYFSNGKPVAIDYNFLIGSDYALSPGTTEYAEINPYTDFDDYKLYISGTCNK